MNRPQRAISGLASLSVFLLALTPTAVAADPVVCQTVNLAPLSASQQTIEIATRVADTECDVVELIGNTTVELTAPIEIEGALNAPRILTIREATGSQIILSAATSDTAIQFVGSEDELRIENLTFIGATASAVKNDVSSDNKLHVGDSHFENNSSQFNGGAIFTAGVLTLSGSNSFHSNDAQGDGGAIFAAGGVAGAGSILDLRLNQSVTGSGGGIHSGSGNVELGGLNSLGNLADASGGAIFTGGSFTVSGSSILNQNEAGFEGGAVFATGAINVDYVSALSNRSMASNGGTFFTGSSFTATGHQTVSRSRSEGASGGYLFAVGNVSILSLYADNGFALVDAGVIAGMNAVSVTGHAEFNLSEASTGNGGAIVAVGAISLGSLTSLDTSADLDGGVLVSYSSSVTIAGGVNANISRAGGRGGVISAAADITISGIYSSSQTTSFNNGGSLYGGGVVAISGPASISNSSSTQGGGGAIYGGQTVKLFGGGIFSNGTSVSDGGCISAGMVDGLITYAPTFFDNCTSTNGSGGAVASQSSVALDLVYFIDCTAFSNGGAIYSASGDVVLNVVANFVGTQSQNGNGGAVAFADNLFTVDVNVTNSSADGNGGSFFSPIGTVMVNGLLSVNTSTAGGNGGVAAAKDLSLLDVEVSFATATTGDGGAIYSPNGDLLVQGTLSIRDSKAPNGNGGAFHVGGNIVLNGPANSFQGNEASGDGGAIFLPQGNIVTSGPVTMLSNSAGSNGGAIHLGGNAVIAGGSFEGNIAGQSGGAIFSPIGSIAFTSDAKFVSNVAGVHGGALQSGSSVVLTTAEFETNSANSDGGAIYMPVGTVVSSSLVSFSGNSAGGNGGAIMADVSLAQALFSQNHSTNSGGAIFGTAVLVGPGSRFTGNVSTLGGAIYGFINPLVLSQVGFDSNEAASHGGAIYWVGARVSLNRSSLHGNIAGGSGAAIYGTDMTLFNSYFANHQVTGGSQGAVIYSSGAIEVGFSTFDENSIGADPVIGAGDYRSIGTVIISQQDEPLAGIFASPDFGGNLFSADTSKNFNRFLVDLGSAIEQAAPVTQTPNGQQLRYTSSIGPTSPARDQVSAAMLQAVDISPAFTSGFKAFLAPFIADPQSAADIDNRPRVGNYIDAGAFEYQQLPQLAISAANLLADGMTLELDFNLPLAAAATPETFEVFVDGAAVESVTQAVANGATRLTLLLSAPVVSGATVTLDYVGTDLISQVENFNGIGLISQQSVVNLSQYTPPPAQSPAYQGPTLFIPFGLGALRPGEVIELNGNRLSGVVAVMLGGLDAKATVLSDTKLSLTIPELAAGEYELELQSSFGSLRIQSPISVVNRIEVQAGVQVIVKRMTDGTAKVWAKNIVGAGKVQFLLNSIEIAWVRAEDTSDPKLRTANGLHYLVRTVNLVPGTNAVEVLLDGERQRRVAYTR